LHLQLFQNGLAYWGVVIYQNRFPSTDDLYLFTDFLAGGGIFFG
jgi:hypothetical protein